MLSLTNNKNDDFHLQDKLVQDSRHYSKQFMVPNLYLICIIKHPSAPWQIYILDAMLHNLIQWYHQVLNHIGMN